MNKQDAFDEIQKMKPGDRWVVVFGDHEEVYTCTFGLGTYTGEIYWELSWSNLAYSEKLFNQYFQEGDYIIIKTMDDLK